MCLGISAFCDRERADVPANQIGFIDYLIRPMFVAMTTITHNDEYIKFLDINYQAWQEQAKLSPKPPSSAGAASPGPRSPSIAVSKVNKRISVTPTQTGQPPPSPRTAQKSESKPFPGANKERRTLTQRDKGTSVVRQVGFENDEKNTKKETAGKEPEGKETQEKEKGKEKENENVKEQKCEEERERTEAKEKLVDKEKQKDVEAREVVKHIREKSQMQTSIPEKKPAKPDDILITVHPPTEKEPHAADSGS